MKCGVCVADAMTVHPIVGDPHMTVRDVATLMDRYDIGSIIIRRGRELLGIVTERDFVRRAIVEGCDPLHTPITRIMTRDVLTVSPHMDLFEALLLMKDSDIRHLPVVEDGKLVGFITTKDILKIQPHLFENIVDMFKLREEYRKLGTVKHSRSATIRVDE